MLSIWLCAQDSVLPLLVSWSGTEYWPVAPPDRTFALSVTWARERGHHRHERVRRGALPRRVVFAASSLAWASIASPTIWSVVCTE